MIATYGLLSDSAAAVIGAMIVAPLMGPMMATTAAVVMGSLSRALRSLALAITGAATVVALSYLLAAIVPDVAISFTGNAELASRGLGALAITPQQARLRRRAFAVFVTGTLIVALPLAVSSYRATHNALDARRATDAVETWLEGADYNVLTVQVSGPQVRATVEGNGALKPVEELADGLAEALNRPVTVVLRTVHAETATSRER